MKFQEKVVQWTIFKMRPIPVFIDKPFTIVNKHRASIYISIYPTIYPTIPSKKLYLNA